MKTAMVLCFAWVVSACALEPGQIPGGQEVADAVAARKGRTELSKLAATMAPGTWAKLVTVMPPKLWTSPPPSRGLHIAGWTDDAHWDSRTGQFLYMGLRQTRQFIAYSEEENTWRVIPLDPESDNPVFQTNTGHIYGTNGFDHERSRFYHLYRTFEELEGGISWFDVRTEVWTKLPPRPSNSGGMCIEWFEAMNGLVVLGSNTWIFNVDRQQWEDLGSSPVDGYHSMFRHNPYRDEVLMAGGNNNGYRAVARLKKNGQIERLQDAPVNLSIGSDKVTIDPQTGRYLVMDAADPKRFFEFDSDKDQYKEVASFADDWPYGYYAMPVCAFIPEYGVVMWAEPSGVFLYKHKPLGDNQAPTIQSQPWANPNPVGLEK